MRTQSACLFTLIYVNDIIIRGSCLSLIFVFIHELSQFFPVKDFGPLYYFLGIKVYRNSSSCFLSQTKYIIDLLVKSNMHNSTSVSTLMFASEKLIALDGPTFEDPHLYRIIVNSLQYLSFIHPNISYVVNRACQYMHCSRLLHGVAIKHILHYLNHTWSLGLFLPTNSSNHLSNFSNADWAD